MLEVNIEKIIPVTEARDMFNKIVDDVEGTDELYVLTKNGKPAAVVVGVNHLEKLTGGGAPEVITRIDNAPAMDGAPAFGADNPVPVEEEESESVFASADDAIPSSQTQSSFASTAVNEISTSGAGAVAAPTAEVAEADLAPAAPSTESTAQVSRINPVPEGFGTDFSKPVPAEPTPIEPAAIELDPTESAPAVAPSQDRLPDADSVVTPDDNMGSSDLEQDPFATINPNTPATTQFAESAEAPAEEAAEEDSAAGPIVPPMAA